MSKVMTIEDAVASYVQPGMKVYMSEATQAAVRAMIRVYRGASAGLHIVAVRGGEIVPDLVAAGLVSEITVASLTNTAVYTGRIAALQHMRAEGVRLTSSSLYVLSLRLMAAGLSWPFIPLGDAAAGSTLEGDAEAGIHLVDLPIAGGTARVALPLHTDVAVLHALAADKHGHAVVSPPYADGVWGSRSASTGVIVTTERLVPSTEVRKYSHYVKIPATRVLAVCETPFSGYPFGFNAIVPGLDMGYSPDTEGMLAYGAAARALETHRRLVSPEVLRASEAEYMAQLPEAGLADARSGFAARARAGRRARNGTLSRPVRENALRELAALAPPERMALVGARVILDAVRRRGIRTVLVGNGSPGVACAIAQSVLRDQGVEVSFVLGTGMIDLDLTRIGRAYEMGSSHALSDTVDTYGTMIAGPRAHSLGILGAAQIDRFGRVNTSFGRGGEQVLAGSGGAADVATLSTEVLVIVPNRPGRFVREVDYVTAPSTRLSCVISDFGFLEPTGPGRELMVTRRFGSDVQLRDVARQIECEAGWAMGIEQALDAPPEPPASPEELGLLAAALGRD
jgi:acyl CoA:acetate/3-ketoacid CoA transferase alpha subunit/acyl CoA:acetate/3-ketoacid CoA transferase beta subunit